MSRSHTSWVVPSLCQGTQYTAHKYLCADALHDSVPGPPRGLARRHARGVIGSKPLPGPGGRAWLLSATVRSSRVLSGPVRSRGLGFLRIRHGPALVENHPFAGRHMSILAGVCSFQFLIELSPKFPNQGVRICSLGDWQTQHSDSAFPSLISLYHDSAWEQRRGFCPR